MHGGDIYSNRVKYDFSVNINPQGVSKRVREALEKSVDIIEKYPDPESRELKAALAGYYSLNKEEIAAGNGASELIMAVFQAFRPKRLIITSPDFTGYKRAAKAVGCSLDEVNIISKAGELKEPETIVNDLIGRAKKGERGDIIMLTNPNNPTGLIFHKELLLRLGLSCRDRGLLLGVDESFLPFTPRDASDSLRDSLKDSPVMIIRSFTKLFAMPGIRLGVLLASPHLIDEVERVLPEWNISAPAAAAGLAAVKEKEYIASTPAVTERERTYLAESMEAMGIKVYPSAADYLLIRSEKPLYEGLLSKGILIRDCSDQLGRGEGYYRLAVRSHSENVILIGALEEVLSEGSKKS